MPTEDATALPQPAAPEGQPLLRKLFAPRSGRSRKAIPMQPVLW